MFLNVKKCFKLFSVILDQNQTLPKTDEPLISETQKEIEYTGSDLPSRFHENKSKVNKNEKSKPDSVSEYLKIAQQAVASDDKEGAIEAYKSALKLKPASFFFLTTFNCFNYSVFNGRFINYF